MSSESVNQPQSGGNFFQRKVRWIKRSPRLLTFLMVLADLLMLQLGSIPSFLPENWEQSSDPVTRALLRGGVGGAISENNHRVLADDAARRQTNVVPSGLEIPRGEAIALPSLRVQKNDSPLGSQFGGTGDDFHLGDSTEFDLNGVSPAVWKHMITYFGVKSLLDIGCGRGISTSWFALHGVDVQCVEGSHDAIQQSLLPDPGKQVVEHDFSRGPWWPSKTVDAVWCVEFVEHISRNYMSNYMAAFRKAALIFVTHSQWGGWHHVEVHDKIWWRAKFESFGFVYSDDLTRIVREEAKKDIDRPEVAPNGKPYNSQHIWTNMKVFINPAVASLPEHAHLFAEPGCFRERKSNKIVHEDCGSGKNSRDLEMLPPKFMPLPLAGQMDEQWYDLVKRSYPVKDGGGSSSTQ